MLLKKTSREDGIVSLGKKDFAFNPKHIFKVRKKYAHRSLEFLFLLIMSSILGKEGWAKAEGNESNIVDHDQDGIPERMVKFDRSAVEDLLEEGDPVLITVTGQIKYSDINVAFTGYDNIRVTDEGKGNQNNERNQKGNGR